MESGIDSYLHKKFKKQLSIDPKVKKNEKENKDNGYSETSEEKNKIVTNEDKNHRCLDAVEKQNPDNNESVPNQSTNQQTSTSSFALKSNFPMSSISVENCIVSQSSNPCISYVVANNINDDRIHASFDIKYSETTNVFNTSSISNTENIYSSNLPYINEELQVYDYTIKNDETELKHEEIQPPPDKTSSGKYVCPYCNLVCSKPSVLQKHIRAHTNERPYPCKSCGFSFKTRSNLYKHCRSRTHANRVMGNKVQDSSNDITDTKNLDTSLVYLENREEQISQKPYKPRFHTGHQFSDNIAKENIEKTNHTKHPTSELLSHHINEIINKKSSVNNTDEKFTKKLNTEDTVPVNSDVRIIYRMESSVTTSAAEQRYTEEPLNLTNKNRKRTMSEVSEPVIQKSLIKELLLKSLSSSDLQCPYCKMIFQTVTELDVHKYRNCKGKPSDIKYTRSSSVNVASILTQNKNAFDNIPHLQNTVFPLNSPGPFLGKTRLIESDKTKSFSFDSGTLPLVSPSDPVPSYLLSPLSFDKEKKAPIKLFGGEVKVHTSREGYKIDGSSEKFESDDKYIEYGGKLKESRVVKSSLQSGGTVLTNKTDYSKHELKTHTELLRVYEGNCNSPNIDISNINKQKFTFDSMTNNSQLLEVNDIVNVQSNQDSPVTKYCTMLDFSQKAVKMLTPNIKQPNFSVSNLLLPARSVSNISFDNSSEIKLSSPKPKTETILQSDVDFPKRPIVTNQLKFVIERKAPSNLYNPMSLVVDGKIIRHVPGMPGPVVAAEPDMVYDNPVVAVSQEFTSDVLLQEKPLSSKLQVVLAERESERSISSAVENRNSENVPKVAETNSGIKVSETKALDIRISDGETKKFARPNSLALKPTTAALKQHHGLTPTMFNQILISPDTPRVAKKYAHHFLHGNYFSYLGLKSSTKPVYCTLNKTQPFYVPHFKKLSMYSEWRQQDTKQDKLYASNYDTRQRNHGYTVAGKSTANLIIHSSYKFMVSEVLTSKLEKGEDQPKTNFVIGGYECNDDYTYIRGRGRGRYVCDQCGIRCKKPSMLKKHIRTHSNDRPYTCNHCNFSFKTKGNLTKHMKSKAHTKNYTASGGSSSSTQHSNQSSESDTEDSGMDSSDESTRQQEHEAAYGLLSLSQKPSSSTIISSDSDLPLPLRSGSPNDFPISSEEVAQVSKTNYARNKFLNDRSSLTINSKRINAVSTIAVIEETTEAQNVRNYLGKCVSRPLTYPYTSILPLENDMSSSPKPIEIGNRVQNPISVDVSNVDNSVEPRSVQQFHVIQKYTSQTQVLAPKNVSPKKCDENNTRSENIILNNKRNMSPNHVTTPTLKLNDVIIANENVADLRKRKFPVIENIHQNKIQRNDEVIDLSMTTTHEKPIFTLEERIFNSTKPDDAPKNVANEIYNTLHKVVPSPQRFDINEDKDNFSPKSSESTNSTVIILRNFQTDDPINNNYTNEKNDIKNNVINQIKLKEYDNSAMETLADVATKQVKLEKNTLAKCVASEYLKLATKNENIDRDVSNFGPVNKDVNDLIVKSEGNKSCTICSKSFNKPSQLRLHMNIHYLERPFRCDSCSVSFRTKGHLQKHERSASHHNKLSSSPAFSSSEPRPFKCSDCNIAFRIHGHLAKHLRSKMHIMKLECLSKIPFGLYAELERSNSLLTEINTTDGDQCLESLKILAKKVFINNPSKLNQLAVRDDVNSVDC